MKKLLPSAKLGSAKLVVVCVGLLGFALVANFLCASSSPLASNWTSKHFSAAKIIVPKEAYTKETHNKGKQVIIKRVPSLEEFYQLLMLICLHQKQSGKRWQLHLCLVLMELQYRLKIFSMFLLVTALLIIQYGPQCRGPTAHTFVLDTKRKQWQDLPPLLVPRYAPATQLWRGRLHVMGGSKENRHTPGLEHWSLAVKDGNALEREWRSEISIPRGGPHRFMDCGLPNTLLIELI